MRLGKAGRRGARGEGSVVREEMRGMRGERE